MQKLRMNRRGVSPVIATLLLVAIAVAAAVVTYTWTMSLAGNQSAQAQTSIKVDLVNFASTTSVELTVRNTGSVGATLEEVFIFEGDAYKTITPISLTTISPGSTTVVTATLSGAGNTFADTTAYRIRIVTTVGFVAEGTYYSPDI